MMIDPKIATIVKSLHDLLKQYERYQWDVHATEDRKKRIVGPMSAWHEVTMKDIDATLTRYTEAAAQQERAFRRKLIQLKKLLEETK